jgi:hypothetical protein
VRPIRRSALALLASAALVAGCGGDDEEDTTAATPAPQATSTAETTEPETTETTDTAETEPQTDTREERGGGEDQEGGAGDEEPIRSEAAITGRGGKLGPRTIRVPAFIAVGVLLRSADGREYRLRIGGETLKADGEDRTDEATLDGLSPGESYRGGGVTIEATAEPGP